MDGFRPQYIDHNFYVDFLHTKLKN